ncbi:unnamed protein product [Didymodactylos carnosus]|uniref:RNA-dependent RNA polymerase n=1 Tax=Didymodactylos carnosus TaxID=1234261 RepID=A0A8S2CTJ4_9BILA|nr:unnamed protein product [Didymodactylos carnosus]CAF3583115.1 unnamed protein product [Didymodactylos carnosus]
MLIMSECGDKIFVAPLATVRGRASQQGPKTGVYPKSIKSSDNSNVVHCSFENLQPENFRSIQHSLSNLYHISKFTSISTDKFEFICSKTVANQICEELDQHVGNCSNIWFCADASQSRNNDGKRNEMRLSGFRCTFGSLLSTEKFTIHDVIDYDVMEEWLLEIKGNNMTLNYLQGKGDKLIFTLPIDQLHTRLLVISSEMYDDVIFSCQTVMDVKQICDKMKKKICGDEDCGKILSRCNDFYLTINDKRNLKELVDYFGYQQKFQIFYTTINIQLCPQITSKNDYFLPYEFSYDASYSIYMLNSLGYMFEDRYRISLELQHTMLTMAQECDKTFYHLSLEACEKLESNHSYNLLETFNKHIFLKLKEQINKLENRKQDVYDIGMVVVTPMRVIFKKKVLSMGHRALREKELGGKTNFLLVYFKEEYRQYLDCDERTKSYYNKIFENGIELNGGRFYFFGSSNSQIQDMSYWFFRCANFDDIILARRILGNFDKIENLALYIARIGLYFTKTITTGIELFYCSNEEAFNIEVKSGKPCVMLIPDIKNNEYCFTDGCGLMSKGLAREIATRLKLLTNDEIKEQISFGPSAYQIRLAGCKGLLIVDPKSTINEYYAKIRESMRKFDSNNWIIDICDNGVSKARPTRLNNQIIMILSDRGVKNETFLKIQRDYFSKIDASTNSYVRKQTIPNVLKNQIPLPDNECRYMFGCSLESALQYGQCYIRYEVLDSDTTKKYECVRGRVIVTKNPCPYAGDILELWAVDLEELECLRDVIVFPAKGERPHPDEIGGSDLDGDGYFVYWGKDLILTNRIKPLDYPPPDKKNHPHPIMPLDIVKHIVSSLGSSARGEIFNLHLTIADLNEDNLPSRTCSPLCIELAKLLCTAIDSSKTGIVIDMKYIRLLKQKYKKYPDFMQKQPSYESQSICGILYRFGLLFKKNDMKALDEQFFRLALNTSPQQRCCMNTPKQQQNEIMSLPTPRSITTDKNINQSTKLFNDDLSSIIQSPPPSRMSTPKSDMSLSLYLSDTDLIDNKTSFNQTNELDSLNLKSHSSSQCTNNLSTNQFLLIDGMTATSTSVQSICIIPSIKPYFYSHEYIPRFGIQLIRQFRHYDPLSTLFYQKFHETFLNNSLYDYSVYGKLKMVISFGYIYCLKQQENLSELPTNVASLTEQHFLSYLIDTFLPSTVITQINTHGEKCLQQIFYQPNHRIQRQYVVSKMNSLFLRLSWFDMQLKVQTNEIHVLCLNRCNEILLIFTRDGKLKNIFQKPMLWFKCFHYKQTNNNDFDLLYELRSFIDNDEDVFQSIFDWDKSQLMTPTDPRTLPFRNNSDITPILSMRVITSIFEYGLYEVHSIHRKELFYLNDDYYKMKCSRGYFNCPTELIEVHVNMHKFQEMTSDDDDDDDTKQQLNKVWAIGQEISHFFDEVVSNM